MRSDLLQHELCQTSAVFGRKSKVRVVFKADLALTDGSTIVLPSVGFGQEVADETAAVMRGFVDHEAGHVRHTDFEALRTWKEKWTAKGDTLAPHVANALEDIRLERRVMAEYPGAEANLRATTTRVNGRFFERVARGEISEAQLVEPQGIAAVAITWQGRLPYGGPTQEECPALVGSDWLRARLPAWVAEIDRCRSTAAICRLAERTAREIEVGRADRERAHEEERRRSGDEAAPAGPEPDEQQPFRAMRTSPSSVGPRPPASRRRALEALNPVEAAEEDGREEECPPESEPEAPAAGDGEEVEDGAAATINDEADAAEADGPEGCPAALAAREEVPDADDRDRRELTKHAGAPAPLATVDPLDLPDAGEVVRELMAGAGLLSGYRPLSTEHDRWHHRSQSTPHAECMRSCDAADYDRLLAAMTGDVNAMRRALTRMLLAQERRDWDHVQEAGRLDTRRFAAAVAGRANVFKTRLDQSELDARSRSLSTCRAPCTAAGRLPPGTASSRFARRCRAPRSPMRSLASRTPS